MAKADYYLCDICDGKVFYDADIPDLLDQMGSWAIICKDCSTKYECVVREKELG